MEGSTPVGKYLGCDQAFRTESRTQADGSKKRVRICEYTMSDFSNSCVDVYLELTGLDRKSLRKVKTPFLTCGKAGQVTG